MAKRTFWQRFGKRLAKRDGKKCFYCGVDVVERKEVLGERITDFWNNYPKNLATIDHVIPRCKGGETSLENMVVCCQSCNAKKGKR